MDLKEEILKTDMLYEGKVFSVEKRLILLPNHKKATRDVVITKNAVGILPITEDGKIILVKQYRSGPMKELLEIPAGKIEEGEDPLMAARRELQEEIGFDSDQMRFLTSVYVSPGILNEKIILYAATDLKASRLENDEDEFIEVFSFTKEEILDKIKKGYVEDAKKEAALFAYFKLSE